MLMKSIVTLLFLFQATLCFDANRVVGLPYLVQNKFSWDKGQLFCWNNNSVLASIRTEDDNKKFPLCNTCWIGLEATQINPFVWKWPEGDTATYVNWESNQNEPDVGLDQNCVTLRSTGKWHNDDCKGTYYFFCQERRLVLVKENKTWEEALEHCRVLGTELFSVVTQYSPPNQLYPNSYGPSYSDYPDHQPIYDLPSVLSENLTYVQHLIQDALTDEVWTGLRFLAGKWLWVNGDMLGAGYKDLPTCPVQGHYCGTLPKNGANLWGIQDCRERKNFLCYKNSQNDM